MPTYLLNEVARRHVTVALSGDGGDELSLATSGWAGVAVDKVLLVPPGCARWRARCLGGFRGCGPRSGRQGSALPREGRCGHAGRNVEWISYVPESWRTRLLAAPADWARSEYRERWQATAGAKTLDRLLALNVDTYLLDDLLVKMDRTSMAHSLEVRSPFLDTELAEFAARLPPHSRPEVSAQARAQASGGRSAPRGDSRPQAQLRRPSGPLVSAGSRNVHKLDARGRREGPCPCPAGSARPAAGGASRRSRGARTRTLDAIDARTVPAAPRLVSLSSTQAERPVTDSSEPQFSQ